MRVISYGIIRDFIREYPDSRVAMSSWYRKLSRAKPSGIHDLKRKFPGVDYVGNKRFVFNVKGNKYRAVVIILFGPQKAYIRFVGTHAMYNRIECSKI